MVNTTGEVREVSVLDLAGGAIGERIDIAMQQVAANIMDPNTKVKEKRQIKIVIDLTPTDENRDTVISKATVTTKLSSYTAIESTLEVHGSQENPLLLEHKRQLAGQMDFDGGEEAPPNLIRMPQHAAV